MSKRNPLEKPFSEELSSKDVIFLDALNDSSGVLLSAANSLRDIGAHANAEFLEVLAEQIVSQLEYSLEEIVIEAESTEDIEPSDEDFSTFEDELAHIYGDYLVWREGGVPERYGAFETKKKFADLLRHVVIGHMLSIEPGVTDDQLIEAAKEAYVSREEYRRRYR